MLKDEESICRNYATTVLSHYFCPYYFKDIIKIYHIIKITSDGTFVFRDGAELKDGKDVKFHRNVKEEVYEIEFLNVSLKSFGKYKLQTDGPAGKKTHECDLKVVGKL